MTTGTNISGRVGRWQEAKRIFLRYFDRLQSF
ncbi:conserved hypothetical protein [Escherichia coli TA206]|nr:conserved hypothetical protein [Escherichia coli TA206]OSK11765.1 hypothetical protein EAOG_00876 [Escherichia coli R527]OSL07722.1 hypothetical protein ECUG_02153 [Escherichia coli H296]OSL12352.1 hypothetical protein ECTG_00383 [Escherichia coli H305]OSL44574.1 hypothetical protein EARG_00354 [Escherichia coli H461]